MRSSLIPGMIVFGLTALVVVIAASRLARTAGELADRTGPGEARFGIFLLAGVISQPDFAATRSAALDARAHLAMSSGA